MNQYLEITNLKSDATMRDIETLCDEAIKNNYAAVCVAPYYVTLASSLLKGTSIEIATVIGDQKGYQTTSVKSYEAIEAIQNGATEIGMGINLCAVKNGDFEYVQEEIEEIRDCIDGKTVKVMVDVSKLTEEELHQIVRICNETFIHYIEVINAPSVLDPSIATILKHKGEVLEVKISDINSKSALTMIEQGVSRIGTENGTIFMKGENK